MNLEVPMDSFGLKIPWVSLSAYRACHHAIQVTLGPRNADQEGENLRFGGSVHHLDLNFMKGTHVMTSTTPCKLCDCRQVTYPLWALVSLAIKGEG